MYSAHCGMIACSDLMWHMYVYTSSIYSDIFRIFYWAKIAYMVSENQTVVLLSWFLQAALSPRKTYLYLYAIEVYRVSTDLLSKNFLIS